MGGEIRHTARLRALFAAMGEAVGPGLAARERRWAGERAGSGLADALVGLAARLALAAELWLWARAGAAPMADWTVWRAWTRPEPGLVEAVAAWAPAAPAGLTTSLILLAAQAGAVMLAAGVLTRLAAAGVLAAAIAFAATVIPEAWTTASVYGALALALVLRGPGAVSLDWSLSRLARFH